MKIYIYMILGLLLSGCVGVSSDINTVKETIVEPNTQTVSSATHDKVDEVSNTPIAITVSPTKLVNIMPTETEEDMMMETPSSGECVFPCVFGIRVGQTNFEEYIETNDDILNVEFRIEENGWEIYLFESTYGSFVSTIDEDRHIIIISGSDLNLTLSELLAREGVPDELWMVPYNEFDPKEISDLNAVLIYKKQGLIIKYYSYAYRESSVCFHNIERSSSIYATDEKYNVLDYLKPYYFEMGDYVYKYKKFQEGDVITPQSFYEAVIADECIEVNLSMWKE